MQESDPNTDIYKNREPMPFSGANRPKKKRRRRSQSRRAFDDHSQRKRRSRNSGFRRLLHLSRKSSNEKVFWSTIGIVTVVLLIALGIWQFWIREMQIRKQEKENNYMNYQPSLPSAAETGALLPTESVEPDSAGQ